MLELALMPLPAPAGLHPATQATLVAAAAYAEALAAQSDDGANDRAVLDAVRDARRTLDQAASAWRAEGEPDHDRDALDSRARLVLGGAGHVVRAQGREALAARSRLLNLLIPWAAADYPGLPS